MSVKDSLRCLPMPRYAQNAVLQLVAASGVGFVGVHLLWITMIVYAVPELRANQLTFEYVGIADLARIRERWWTLLSYGWCHKGFWEWLSNMVWLYCFGNVVQSLVGYKQIILLFLAGILAGGLAFAGVQLIPGAALPPGYLVMGAQAGIMAMMAAALTLSPGYRLYLGDYFSVPLWVPALLFVLLMLLNTALLLPSLGLLAAGALAGFAYIRMLRAGYNPGAWLYRLHARMDRSLTPKEDRRPSSAAASPALRKQQRIDRILDKISDKGLQSLTAEEKAILEDKGN